MLTKRQQEVLRRLQSHFADDGYAFKSEDHRSLWNVDFGEYCAASTLYHLIDAELAGMGELNKVDVVALTPRGRELAAMLTATLTKRQQQALQLLQREAYAFKSDLVFLGYGLWVVGDVNIDGDEARCSASTLYYLADAELIGFGVNPDTGGNIAALTPRGRRLAALLPRS